MNTNRQGLPGRWARLRGMGRNDVSAWLIGTMLLLALLPVSIISVAAQTTLRGSLTDSQAQALFNETAGVRGEIEGLLARDLALTEYTARNSFVVRYAAAAPEDRSRYQDLAEQQLKALQRQDTSFEVVGLIGADGVFYSDAPGPNDKARLGVKVDFRDYFKAAMAGSSFISDIQVGLTSNKPSVFFSAPVKDESGKVVSVLNLRIGTDPLQKIIAQRAGVQEAMLIDYDGIILAHSTNNDRFQYHSMFPLSAAEQDDVAQNKRFGNNVQQVDALNAKGFEAGFDRGPEV